MQKKIIMWISTVLALANAQSQTQSTKICGYNGQKYRQFCSAASMMKCNRRQIDENLRYVEKPLLDCTNKPCPKVCVLLYAPVCATNGVESKLFGNECELQAQNECVAKTPDQMYYLANATSCNSVVTTVLPCTLNCPPVSYPVPTTGSWFDNKCLMEQSNLCDGTNYSVLNSINAYGNAPVQCPAVCGEVYAPVCANDGSVNQIFGNQCLVAGYNRCVRGTTNPHFQVVPFSQREQCLQTASMSCPMNCYGRPFEPICAADGTINRWFPNFCEMGHYNRCGALTPMNFVQTAMENCN